MGPDSRETCMIGVIPGESYDFSTEKSRAISLGRMMKKGRGSGLISGEGCNYDPYNRIRLPPHSAVSYNVSLIPSEYLINVSFRRQSNLFGTTGAEDQ